MLDDQRESERHKIEAAGNQMRLDVKTDSYRLRGLGPDSLRSSSRTLHN
jgi:hypothetical protein